jgi:hypothetical protein
MYYFVELIFWFFFAEGIIDNRSKVVVIGVPTIAAVLIAFVACWYCLWRRRRLAAKALQLSKFS